MRLWMRKWLVMTVAELVAVVEKWKKRRMKAVEVGMG